MDDSEKIREQLLIELADLREEVTKLKASKSEERYKILAESSTDIIYILDKEGALLYANQSAVAPIGISQAEIVGKRQEDLFPPEMAKQHNEWIRQVLETGEAREYDELFQFGPKEIWLNVRLIPLLDKQGKVDSVMGICRNITDRKQTELELTKSRAMLRATIDCLPFDFFALGSDGRYILQNATSKAHWGDVMGKLPEEASPHEDVLAIWQDNNRRAFAGEKVEGDVSYSYQGGKRFFHNVITSIRSGETMHGILGVNIDITERMQAEEALQKAHDALEQRVKERTAELLKTNEELAVFRKFAEASGQGFGMSELDGRIVYVNPTLCRIFGEDRPGNVVGKFFQTYYSDEWKEKRAKEVIPTLEREGHWEGEIPILSRQGKLIPALHHIVHLKDGQGRAFRRASLVTDITERKKSEKALQQSYDELGVIYNEMVDGLLVTDIETLQYVRANASMCRMLGYSETELLSMSVRDLHPVEALPHILESIRSAEVVEQAPTRSIPILRKDGSVFYAEIIGKFLIYNGRPCVMGIFRDITERKRAEEAIRKSEERFRSYFEQGLMGMAVTSLDKQWLEINDRFCEILGYSREELLQKKFTDYLHPDDSKRSKVEFDQLISGEIDYYTVDRRYIRKDGRLVYTTVFVRCFRTEEGKADHILALVEDITERKKTQEALQKERRTLKHLLQSSDHERQLIAYEIHDGLAQQLAGAIMQFQTYKHLKETKPKEAEKAYDAGVTMLQQGHFEARRLIHGVRPPILDELGVVEAIAHLVHEESRRKRPKIEFHSRVDFGRLAPILENAIYRIIQEGLANACKHSKSEKVQVSLTQRKEHVRIEIHDQGVGFAPEKVSKNCFGLEGMRERARLLGGKSSIRSVLGKGTKITVELPLVKRE